MSTAYERIKEFIKDNSQEATIAHLDHVEGALDRLAENKNERSMDYCTIYDFLMARCYDSNDRSVMLGRIRNLLKEGKEVALPKALQPRVGQYVWFFTGTNEDLRQEWLAIITHVYCEKTGIINVFVPALLEQKEHFNFDTVPMMPGEEGRTECWRHFEQSEAENLPTVYSAQQSRSPRDMKGE